MNDVTVVFASCHTCGYDENNPQGVLEESVQALAKAAKGVEDTKYLVLEDPGLAELIFGNQCGFFKELQAALDAEDVGISILETMSGGGANAVEECITKEHSEWTWPPEQPKANGFVYTVYTVKT